MSVERRAIPHLFIVISLILVSANVGFSQQPFSDFNVGPTTLVQGECYSAWVTPPAPGMHLDIQYTLNGGPLQTLYDWPVMDATGVARNICTNLGTAAGTYVFVNVRQSQSQGWLYVGKRLTVLPQPTGMSFNANSGYAGIDRYILTVSGGKSMAVRVRYNLNGYQNLTGVITTDSNGKYDSGVLDHYLYIGNYYFTGIQNASAQSNNWVNIGVPYTILPPQPTSFYLDKSLIMDEGTNGDQTYHMYAANGADMFLDLKYTIGNGPLQELDRWPWLYRDSPSSWNGHSNDIHASTCTIPGLYRFTSVRNSLNAAWVPITPPRQLTVVGPGVPQISAVNPSGASAGQSLTVIINGEKLCGATLTTTYPGLSVSVAGSGENQVVASVGASPTVVAGNAVVTLHAFGGNVDFTFAITRNGMGGPSVTSVSPSSAAQGSSVVVTIAGTNLVGPTLSTTWPGLTFSNVTPNTNGTSLTATFAVAESAPLGNPSINLTTPTGVTTTQLFWIGIPTLPALSREYIYLGDRVLAVESP